MHDSSHCMSSSQMKNNISFFLLGAEEYNAEQIPKHVHL